MPEKSSNTASIVVAVITLLLILGGVYLLNNSFNPQNDTSDTTASEDTSTRLNDDENDGSNLDDDDTDLTDDLALPGDEVNQDDIRTIDRPGTEQPPEEDDDTTTTPPPVAGDADEPEEEPTPSESDELSSNEFRAIYQGTSGGLSSWEITECGLPNATICVPGVTLSLIGVEQYTSLTVGNTYLFVADFAERNSQLEIDLIESVTVVI
jgi:hypothetical protein